MTELKIMIFLAFVFLVLGGCNMVEGAGKDMQSAGEGMKDSANENKTY